MKETMMSEQETKPELSKMEGIKGESRQLFGTIGEELFNDSDEFSGDATQLLKFHGTYQQDNRDLRNRKDEHGNRMGKAHSCMIRTGLPGGLLTAAQFLTQMNLCDRLGEGTLRLTTRQAIQLHCVLKKNMREALHEINKAGMTSLAACGDVNRNVMCNPSPYKNSPVIAQMQATAAKISAHLKPKTTAYYELWITDEFGEKYDFSAFVPPEEPIYGKTYLPRKFKIGLALPEDNHTDILAQDIGMLGIVENDNVIGYDFYVGGGMGRTPSAEKTYPALGKALAFVPADEALAVAETIVKVQRDFGDRVDRKTARMKYLVVNWGIEKFRAKVEEYYGKPLQPLKNVLITGVDDYMGWREQGDGKLAIGINVENGRV